MVSCYSRNHHTGAFVESADALRKMVANRIGELANSGLLSDLLKLLFVGSQQHFTDFRQLIDLRY